MENTENNNIGTSSERKQHFPRKNDRRGNEKIENRADKKHPKSSNADHSNQGNPKNPNRRTNHKNINPNKKPQGNTGHNNGIHGNGVYEVKSIHEKGNLNLHRELKKNVDSNIRIQKNSLNPHYKLNLNSKAKVRITPLGGLGEIGANMTVIETEKSAIIIDVGMSFPDETMLGVDILIPDFSYIQAIKDKIAGVIITHAHEDHIGAVPYLYKQMQFPLYGTPLPLGMISAKFDEHGLKKYRSLFRSVEKRKPIQIGDFEIEWIHITHSVIDASALAIRTEAGIIFHTGDFKIDHTPIDGLPTDLHRLAHYGEEGVMLLLSDSTNSHKSGVTPSEATVGPTFDNLFKHAQGRVIMSTFSSNIHRVYQAINFGIKYGRKVAVIGRSMEKNLEIARELGYITFPQGVFIEAHEVEKYPDEEVLIVTTGSQGETMSALYRMATDEHRHIKIKPTDLIIISAKAIPGNEGSVSTVINFLQKSGAQVAYQDFSEIHVSGHAAQEEQKLMLRLIKPKFFLPVHGEYNHIAKHKETAIKCGVPERNIFLMDDGDQIEVNPNYIRKVRSVKTGKIFVDNQSDRIVDYNMILDRQNLANDGVLIIGARIEKAKLDFKEGIKLSSFGLTDSKDEKNLTKEVQETLLLMLKAFKKDLSAKNLEIEARNVLKRFLFKKYKKYPLVAINFFMD